MSAEWPSGQSKLGEAGSTPPREGREGHSYTKKRAKARPDIAPDLTLEI